MAGAYNLTAILLRVTQGATLTTVTISGHSRDYSMSVVRFKALHADIDSLLGVRQTKGHTKQALILSKKEQKA
jgi:hypothetical protein